MKMQIVLWHPFCTLKGQMEGKSIFFQIVKLSFRNFTSENCETDFVTYSIQFNSILYSDCQIHFSASTTFTKNNYTYMHISRYFDHDYWTTGMDRPWRKTDAVPRTVLRASLISAVSTKTIDQTYNPDVGHLD